MGYINESIIYNIYPLGFCGAPRDNDGKLVYRLDKIYDCIEHLKKMSINALVFNPLFESSRHGYDTIDYRKVDCRLGDNNSFKKICNTLHENGIKVILDGVFNHVGRDFLLLKTFSRILEIHVTATGFRISTSAAEVPRAIRSGMRAGQVTMNL